MSLRLWLRASYGDQLWLTSSVMAGEQSLRAFEKHILLCILDDKW